MSIFNLRQSVIDEYSKYAQSFLSIADERVRAFIRSSLLKNRSLVWTKGPTTMKGEKFNIYLSDTQLDLRPLPLKGEN
jgi:hypothetical protein